MDNFEKSGGFLNTVSHPMFGVMWRRAAPENENNR